MNDDDERRREEMRKMKKREREGERERERGGREQAREMTAREDGWSTSFLRFFSNE